MRQPVAKSVERDALEHDIGRAAIGGRIAGALLGLNQRIGLLRGVTAIDTHFNFGEIEFLSIGPDPTNERNLTFGQRISGIAEIAVTRDLRPALAAMPFSSMTKLA